MDSFPLEKQILSFAARLVVICILLAWLTSCQAYEDPPATATTIPARSTIPGPAPKSHVPTLAPTSFPSCTVTGEAVYLRSGAGMSHAPLTVLHRGDTLQIVRRGAWLKVRTAGQETGWVYGRYCR